MELRPPLFRPQGLGLGLGLTLADLAAPRLRKTETQARSDTREHLARQLQSARAAAAGAAATRDYLLSGAVETWYEDLRDLTFRTAFTMIEPAEATAMIASNRVNAALASASTSASTSASSSGFIPFAPVPAALNALARRMDALLAAFPRGASVKLSTRSPKDSAAVMARAAAAYRARLDAHGNIPGVSGDELHQLNARVIAFTEERTRAAIVRTGDEAVGVLLDSGRVLEDLVYAYESPDFDPRPLAVVAREWNANIRPACEFRAFTWNGKLTCIGQYFYQMYFPELEALRPHIVRDLTALVADVMRRPRVVPNAMLDLLWFGPGNCMLIEINPLDEDNGSTLPGSTGMFSWEGDTDLMHGRRPFELRLRTEPPSRRTLRDNVGPQFRRLLGIE